MAVILGTIVASFGIKGEVKIHSNTDFAKYRYQKDNVLTLYSPIKKESVEVKVISYKSHKNVDIVLFDIFSNPEQVIKYIGYQVLCDREETEFEDGIYHYDDIWKAKVYHNETYIGEVSDMINATSQITLRIKRDNKKDLLYPFVDRFIEKIDVENKIIYINPLEGMLDL